MEYTTTSLSGSQNDTIVNACDATQDVATCSAISATCVKLNDNPAQFTTIANRTYNVIFYNEYLAGGDFSFAWQSSARQSCSAAESLAPLGFGDTSLFGVEDVEPLSLSLAERAAMRCVSSQQQELYIDNERVMWYDVIGTGARHTVSGCTTGMSVAVFQGTCAEGAPDLTSLSCVQNVIVACNGYGSSVTWFAQQDVTYKVALYAEQEAIDDYYWRSDSATVSQLLAPANDQCQDAIPVAMNSIARGTTAGAENEYATCSRIRQTTPGVWYSFEGTGGRVQVDVCDQENVVVNPDESDKSDNWALFRVFDSDCEVCATQSEAENKLDLSEYLDSCYRQLDTELGKTYKVMVTSHPGPQTFALRVSDAEDHSGCELAKRLQLDENGNHQSVVTTYVSTRTDVCDGGNPFFFQLWNGVRSSWVEIVGEGCDVKVSARALPGNSPDIVGMFLFNEDCECLRRASYYGFRIFPRESESVSFHAEQGTVYKVLLTTAVKPVGQAWKRQVEEIEVTTVGCPEPSSEPLCSIGAQECPVDDVVLVAGGEFTVASVSQYGGDKRWESLGNFASLQSYDGAEDYYKRPLLVITDVSADIEGNLYAVGLFDALPSAAVSGEVTMRQVAKYDVRKQKWEGLPAGFEPYPGFNNINPYDGNMKLIESVVAVQGGLLLLGRFNQLVFSGQDPRESINDGAISAEGALFYDFETKSLDTLDPRHDLELFRSWGARSGVLASAVVRDFAPDGTVSAEMVYLGGQGFTLDLGREGQMSSLGAYNALTRRFVPFPALAFTNNDQAEVSHMSTDGDGSILLVSGEFTYTQAQTGDQAANVAALNLTSGDWMSLGEGVQVKAATSLASALTAWGEIWVEGEITSYVDAQGVEQTFSADSHHILVYELEGCQCWRPGPTGYTRARLGMSQLATYGQRVWLACEGLKLDGIASVRSVVAWNRNTQVWDPMTPIGISSDDDEDSPNVLALYPYARPRKAVVDAVEPPLVASTAPQQMRIVGPRFRNSTELKVELELLAPTQDCEVSDFDAPGERPFLCVDEDDAFKTGQNPVRHRRVLSPAGPGGRQCPPLTQEYAFAAPPVDCCVGGATNICDRFVTSHSSRRTP